MFICGACAARADDAVAGWFHSTSPTLAHEVGDGHPVRDRELISLALGICALVLVAANRRRLAQVPGARWWLAALLTREAAWAFAVADGVVGLGDIPLVETLLLTISTGLMAIGAWRTFSLINGGEVRR